MLAQASELLQAGEQTKAQRALSNVFNINGLDAASNEDARVQLENLQTQQAIVGLNTRRQRLYLDNDLNQTEVTGNEQMRQAAAANPILQQDQLNYRPQELSQLLAGNTSEDNACCNRSLVVWCNISGPPKPAPQAIVITCLKKARSTVSGAACRSKRTHRWSWIWRFDRSTSCDHGSGR